MKAAASTTLPARRPVTEVDESRQPSWSPTPRQEAYLQACLNPETARTITARAAAARVSRQAVYKWMQLPEFRAWLSTQRQLAFEHGIDDVKQRCLELAAQGSPEHIRIVLELAGELGRGAAHVLGSAQVGIGTVYINVPRPAPDDDATDIGSPVLPLPASNEHH